MTWDDASTRPQPAPRRADVSRRALHPAGCAPRRGGAAGERLRTGQRHLPPGDAGPGQASRACCHQCARRYDRVGPSRLPRPTAAATKPAQASVAATTAPAAKAQRPQLVVAQTADILTLDPTMHRQRQTQNVHQLIFDSLVHRTDDLEISRRTWRSPGSKLTRRRSS